MPLVEQSIRSRLTGRKLIWVNCVSENTLISITDSYHETPMLVFIQSGRDHE